MTDNAAKRTACAVVLVLLYESLRCSASPCKHPRSLVGRMLSERRRRVISRQLSSSLGGFPATHSTRCRRPMAPLAPRHASERRRRVRHFGASMCQRRVPDRRSVRVADSSHERCLLHCLRTRLASLAACPVLSLLIWPRLTLVSCLCSRPSPPLRSGTPIRLHSGSSACCEATF